MGFQNFQPRTEKLLNSDLVREPFHLFTTTLLALLLPLSFLLLARILCARYVISIASNLNSEPSSFIWDLFIYTNRALLYGVVYIISIATLVHGLTGKIAIIIEPPSSSFCPNLHTAWFFLCILQVCIGLGFDGSIVSGVSVRKDTNFGPERNLMSRVIFFLGLHETMVHWFRMVVKPVVDDTVFGVVRKERWVQRLALAASLGSLWCWKLKDEIESLVGIGMADFVGWSLYYLTITIGMVRVVKGLIWIGMFLFSGTRVSGNLDNNFVDDDHHKV